MQGDLPLRTPCRSAQLSSASWMAATVDDKAGSPVWGGWCRSACEQSIHCGHSIEAEKAPRSQGTGNDGMLSATHRLLQLQFLLGEPWTSAANPPVCADDKIRLYSLGRLGVGHRDAQRQERHDGCEITGGVRVGSQRGQSRTHDVLRVLFAE